MTSFAFILGVVPLVIASGAGAEMRQSLGTAVFSGMLGVTLFGIFLTPVFFDLIQRAMDSRLFSSAFARWIGSAVAGGLLGLATGVLLARMGVVRAPEAAEFGAAIGAVVALAVPAYLQWVRSATAPKTDGGTRP